MMTHAYVQINMNVEEFVIYYVKRKLVRQS